MILLLSWLLILRNKILRLWKGSDETPLVALGSGFAPFQSGGDRVLRWRSLIEDASRLYSVPASLIAAVIEVESSGDPEARRYENHIDDYSIGLMQVLTKTAAWLGVHGDLTDPAIGIDAGTKYLKYQLDRYDGYYSKAIAAYNAGSIHFDESSRFINQQYVEKVLVAWYKYEGAFGD